MSRVKSVERQKFWERNQKSGGYLLKKTINATLYKVARAILLFGLCFLILQPLFNKISISFMAEKDLYDSTVISIPRNFTFSNYRLANELLEFWVCLKNTVLVAMLVSVIQVAACTLAGYGFARYKFPLRDRKSVV